MTLVDKVLRYFKKKNDGDETEIVIYDSLKEDNYYQSFYPIVLENNFKGSIVCLGEIHIKKNASFSGDLICRTCKIEGSFNGSLLATEFTGVCKTASLDARIVTGSIFIESNATVKGIFNITKEITNPEAMRKLEANYRLSLPQNDDEQNVNTNKVTTIVLRGKGSKAAPGASLPSPVVVPEIKKQDVPVNTLTHPGETKMNRSEETATNTNTGWW
ncbi:MAG TPA: polymer-forming cytoskeletal protein [Sphingobacteriaceae bacterium]